ncbi:hypothetical protein [Roseateles sp.]|jgi:hypothetical protein
MGRRLLTWAIAAAVLGAVLLAYRHPSVVIELSEQLGSCFG